MKVCRIWVLVRGAAGTVKGGDSGGFVREFGGTKKIITGLVPKLVVKNLGR
jgi:hypothetical protein